MRQVPDSASGAYRQSHAATAAGALVAPGHSGAGRWDNLVAGTSNGCHRCTDNSNCRTRLRALFYPIIADFAVFLAGPEAFTEHHLCIQHKAHRDKPAPTTPRMISDYARHRGRYPSVPTICGMSLPTVWLSTKLAQQAAIVPRRRHSWPCLIFPA